MCIVPIAKGTPINKDQRFFLEADIKPVKLNTKL